jgi:hypothetical protein
MSAQARVERVEGPLFCLCVELAMLPASTTTFYPVIPSDAGAHATASRGIPFGSITIGARATRAPARERRREVWLRRPHLCGFAFGGARVHSCRFHPFELICRPERSANIASASRRIFVLLLWLRRPRLYFCNINSVELFPTGIGCITGGAPAFRRVNTASVNVRAHFSGRH